MLIAKIENDAVVEVVDYRQKFNGLPSDELLANYGYKKVNLFREHNTLTQKLVPSEPVIEGDWVYTVSVTELTAEEIQAHKDSSMAQLRAIRNNLLKDCDWTQIADSTADKQAWATYRQALRDFPATVEDARLPYTLPHDPNWIDLKQGY